MPLDPMMSDAMLGTFRKMAQEIKDKNITGEDADNMHQTLARMEELVQTHDDLNAFNGQVTQENLFGKFSDYYGRCLSAQAQEASSDSTDGGYDDAALLKQTLDALRNAVKSIRDSKQEAIRQSQEYDPKKAMEQGLDYVARNADQFGLGGALSQVGGIDKMKEASAKQIDEELAEKPNAYNNVEEIKVLIDDEGLTQPIEELIALGEQEGMTFPRFLRLQIEKGMDKAMEGTAVIRDSYVFDLEWQKANARCPHHITKAERKIELFDKLAEKTPFKIPQSDELNFDVQRLDYEFEPQIILWEEITDRSEKLLWDLSFWSLSYTRFAPQLDPWRMAANVQKAIKRTKDTTPGTFKQRERLLQKYFGMSFMDIFKHETFVWLTKNKCVDYSQEYTEFLIEKVYPQCNPSNHLSSDIISDRETFYQDKKETNPEILEPMKKFMTFYDSKFGEGRFVSKYGPPNEIECNAQPWNWESFKFK